MPLFKHSGCLHVPGRFGLVISDANKMGALHSDLNMFWTGLCAEVAEGAFLSKNYGEPAPIPAVRVVNVGGPCKDAGLKHISANVGNKESAL